MPLAAGVGAHMSVGKLNDAVAVELLWQIFRVVFHLAHVQFAEANGSSIDEDVPRQEHKCRSHIVPIVAAYAETAEFAHQPSRYGAESVLELRHNKEA